jgi:hypothetical protein
MSDHPRPEPIQQRAIENLHVEGNFTIYDGIKQEITQNYYSGLPQPELTIDWMRQLFQEAKASAGARYTPEIHVDLPEAWVFEGLGRTEQFFDKIEDLYGQLCRKWSKAKPPTELKQKFPEIAQSLKALGQSVIALAGALKQIDQDSFTLIDFSSLATLAQKVEEVGYNCLTSTAQKVEEVGYNCLTSTRQAELLPEEEATTAAENRSTHSLRQELLGSVRHHIFQVQEVAREINNLAISNSAKAANIGALLLLGEAGTGKTHLFCDVTKRRLDESLPTLILLGQHFHQGDPWTQILQRLHLPFQARNDFLSALDAAAQNRGCRALILIDALNEGDGKQLWRNELAGIISILSNYPHIAIAVSCRISYERTVIPKGLVPEKLVKVCHRGFDDCEYIATRTFFDYYGIQRPSIPLLVPEFSNPLFLKILCEGLHKRNLTRIPKGLTTKLCG